MSKIFIITKLYKTEVLNDHSGMYIKAETYNGKTIKFWGNLDNHTGSNINILALKKQEPPLIIKCHDFKENKYFVDYSVSENSLITIYPIKYQDVCLIKDSSNSEELLHKLNSTTN